MSTGVPADTHQNLKILGTAGYRVPRKFQKLGTGYRENFKSSVSLGTGYQREKIFWVSMDTGYRPDKKIWVPGTSQKIFIGYRWVLGTSRIFNDADPRLGQQPL